MAQSDTLDFGERLSRKVLASLRSLNASLGEVRVSVAKIDSIAHQRLTISAGGSPTKASDTTNELFTSSVLRPRETSSSSLGLDAPVLKKLLMSPSLRGVGLDEGVLSELGRVLDPEVMADVRKHVEPRHGGRGKDTRTAHTPPSSTWQSPKSGGRRQGQPSASDGGGGASYSSDEDTATAGHSAAGETTADGEDASEDQTLAQARRYRQRSARGVADKAEGSAGKGPQATDDEDDSDSSADFGAAAGRQAATAGVPQGTAAVPPPPPGTSSSAIGSPGPGVYYDALANALDQRQRIDAFQAASPGPKGPGASAEATIAGDAASQPPPPVTVVYAFPRYVDPPAEQIEDDGEDDDIPVHGSELQEVRPRGGGSRSTRY